MGVCSLGFKVKLDVYFVEYGLWFEDSGSRIKNLGWVQAFGIRRVSSSVCSGLGIEFIGHTKADGAEQSHKPVSVGLTEVEELKKYITIREEVYKKAKEFGSKIISFETAIRRPYFHVRPLNSVELENWTSYLDFIEREGDLSKVVKLYERCLIACANYPEYWIQYVLCMEASGSTDIANNTLARATQVLVKNRRFTFLLLERSGDIPGAQAAYQLAHSELPPEVHRLFLVFPFICMCMCFSFELSLTFFF
ncbi:hypothetical protein TB2_007893 [Malus domestica]